MKRQVRTEGVGKKEENEDFGIAESLGRSVMPEAETGAVTPRFSTSRLHELLHCCTIPSWRVLPWHDDIQEKG